MRTLIWFLYFWLYLLWLLPCLYRARRAEAAGDTAARDAIVTREVALWARRLIALAGIKVTVTGMENIPKDEPVVFVSNHQGNFDIPLLLAYLDRPHGLVAKDALEKLPLIRDWMRLLGCVFIDRSNARQSVTALGVAAVRLREQGQSFIIFPEGTRNLGGELLEFKNGAFKIAFKAGAPVLPVCIDGTYKAMEARRNWIGPADVHLTILPPIPTAQMSREQSKQLGIEVRTLIFAHLQKNSCSTT